MWLWGKFHGMKKMTPNEYIRKLQKEYSMAVERDLGEEAEDEILKSTGKDDYSEEFMESVYKKELGSNFETVDSGVAVGFVDFTEDSEYKRLLKIQARARGEKEKVCLYESKSS